MVLVELGYADISFISSFNKTNRGWPVSSSDQATAILASQLTEPYMQTVPGGESQITKIELMLFMDSP